MEQGGIQGPQSCVHGWMLLLELGARWWQVAGCIGVLRAGLHRWGIALRGHTVGLCWRAAWRHAGVHGCGDVLAAGMAGGPRVIAGMGAVAGGILAVAGLAGTHLFRASAKLHGQRDGSGERRPWCTSHPPSLPLFSLFNIALYPPPSLNSFFLRLPNPSQIPPRYTPSIYPLSEFSLSIPA